MELKFPKVLKSSQYRILLELKFPKVLKSSKYRILLELKFSKVLNKFPLLLLRTKVPKSFKKFSRVLKVLKSSE